MANIVLGIFAAIFFICILTGSELLYALGAGFFLFVGYGLYKKYSLSDVLSMAWKGVMSVRTIFIVFMLIGMLTGVWRASGTIAYIITLASDFIEPSIFILIAFLLNCAVSFLLGTSFGTSATMGVITMSIGMTIGMPPAMVGGAILAGVYFGDRMSPVSTSALLVSVLTEVDLYTNIRNMAKSAALPFLISCVIYFALGEMLPDAAASAAASADFEELYIFSPILALPAVSILLLSFFRVPVKTNMAVSIALAALLSLDGYLFGISQRQSPAVERLRLGRQLATVTQNDIDFAPHHLAVLALANERLPDSRRNDCQGEILRVAVERPGHGAAQGNAVVDSDGRIAVDRHLDLVGRQLPDSDDEPVGSRQRLLCDLAYAFRIHTVFVRSGPDDFSAGPLIQQKGGTARPPPLILMPRCKYTLFFRPLQYFRVIFR